MKTALLLLAVAIGHPVLGLDGLPGVDALLEPGELPGVVCVGFLGLGHGTLR